MKPAGGATWVWTLNRTASLLQLIITSETWSLIQLFCSSQVQLTGRFLQSDLISHRWTSCHSTSADSVLWQSCSLFNNSLVWLHSHQPEDMWVWKKRMTPNKSVYVPERWCLTNTQPESILSSCKQRLWKSMWQFFLILQFGVFEMRAQDLNLNQIITTVVQLCMDHMMLQTLRQWANEDLYSSTHRGRVH